jgi:hypothetical protein
MNQAVSASNFAPSEQIDLRSSELEELLARIAAGESERERERVLPFTRRGRSGKT